MANPLLSDYWQGMLTANLDDDGCCYEIVDARGIIVCNVPDGRNVADARVAALARVNLIVAAMEAAMEREGRED